MKHNLYMWNANFMFFIFISEKTLVPAILVKRFFGGESNDPTKVATPQRLLNPKATRVTTIGTLR